MFKEKALITVFVPPEEFGNVEKVIEENPKIGKLGRYNNVYTFSKSEGHFLPLEGSHPVQGEVGETKEVEYVKVETYCEVKDSEEVVETIANHLSYEHPEIKVSKSQVFFPGS